VSDKEPCSNCGRSTKLRYRGPNGRLCSNCGQVRGAKTCGTCGEIRRVAGRDANGKPWCERCKQRVVHAVSDERCRADVLAAVARADPDLAGADAKAALASAVGTSRSLRRLARIVRADPNVLKVGPNTHPPVLARFTTALIECGAKVVAIYPQCQSCGRSLHLRGNGLCDACDAQSRKEECGRCGNKRVVWRRDATGAACCQNCVSAERRAQRLEELATIVVNHIRAADASLTTETIEAAIIRITPKRPDRECLAEELRKGEALNEPHRRSALVARFLAELRNAGSLLPQARCETCGNDAVSLVTTHGVVRCRGCVAPRKKARLNYRVAFGRRVKTVTRIRGTCTGCARAEVILDDDNKCRTCRERAAHRCESCGDDAVLRNVDGRRLCYRCVFTRELDEFFAPVQSDPCFEALRNAILGAVNAQTARRWLQRSSGGRLLLSVVASGERFSHEMLDAAGDDRSIRHLRALLIASGVLGEEGRSVDRFENRFRFVVDEANLDATDRRVARSWLRWQVLARLRRREERGEPMTHSMNNALNKVRQVVRFLEWIDERGERLASLSQASIDEWFALPGALPERARPFLVWAQGRNHISKDLEVPPSGRRSRLEIGDDATRWALARRIVVDDHLGADVRVAGALLLLYGQPLARIARLGRDNVRQSIDGTTILDLDGHPLPIHEPFATLVEELPVRRRQGVRDQFTSNWLFPGDEPDRHVAPNTLATRLRRIGVEPRLMRNTARAQLAAEIPSSLLCEIIGINSNTAVAWASRAAGNWTSYVNERANQRVESQH